MQFTAERRLDGGLLERRFVIGDAPGVLWTPEPSPAPCPLVLLGHPGGLDRMLSRLVGRARAGAADGLASATLELPGSGDRIRVPALEQARSEVRRALEAGDPVAEEVIDRLVLPLVELAVPELQAAVDALLALPEVAGPVGYSGGVISIGIRLALLEPRIVAAALFAGSFVPLGIVEDARAVTIPVHLLLQWDDEGNDRQRALELFDALGSREKSLHANLGGHTGIPAHAGQDAAAFLARHLRPAAP